MELFLPLRVVSQFSLTRTPTFGTFSVILNWRVTHGTDRQGGPVGLRRAARRHIHATIVSGTPIPPRISRPLAHSRVEENGKALNRRMPSTRTAVGLTFLRDEHEKRLFV